MYQLPIEGEPQDPQEDKVIIDAYEKILLHKDYQIHLLEEQIGLLNEHLDKFRKNYRQDQKYMARYEDDLKAYERLYGTYQTKFIN
jgi:hypothetical protein